ncbi:hypothetical protein D3C86_1968010 [compost metagenome]
MLEGYRLESRRDLAVWGVQVDFAQHLNGVIDVITFSLDQVENGVPILLLGNLDSMLGQLIALGIHEMHVASIINRTAQRQLHGRRLSVLR